MNIAVTYENGAVFQHFGHTRQMKLYQVEGGAVQDSRVVSTQGSGHGALAAFLQGQGVDALICGGIGGGAQQALAQAGIALYAGVEGGADQAVQALLRGELVHNPNPTCGHHGGDHSCGGHGGDGHACRHGQCT